MDKSRLQKLLEALQIARQYGNKVLEANLMMEIAKEEAQRGLGGPGRPL